MKCKWCQSEVKEICQHQSCVGANKAGYCTYECQLKANLERVKEMFNLKGAA